MFYTIHRTPSPRLVAAGRSGISLPPDSRMRDFMCFKHNYGIADGAKGAPVSLC
jgi:hypothetical protein